MKWVIRQLRGFEGGVVQLVFLSRYYIAFTFHFIMIIVRRIDYFAATIPLGMTWTLADIHSF